LGSRHTGYWDSFEVRFSAACHLASAGYTWDKEHFLFVVDYYILGFVHSNLGFHLDSEEDIGDSLDSKEAFHNPAVVVGNFPYIVLGFGSVLVAFVLDFLESKLASYHSLWNSLSMAVELQVVLSAHFLLDNKDIVLVLDLAEEDIDLVLEFEEDIAVLAIVLGFVGGSWYWDLDIVLDLVVQDIAVGIVEGFHHMEVDSGSGFD